jgi:hypothetical protein
VFYCARQPHNDPQKLKCRGIAQKKNHGSNFDPKRANSFLLFWLSLIPAATAWMGENFLVPIPTALYGGILLMPAIAYHLLQKAILRKQGKVAVTERGERDFHRQ